MTSNLVDFFAGCLGGVAGVLVGHPLDTVKVKLQTQGMITNAGGVLYRSTAHCLVGTFQASGINGLYRGMASPLYSLTFINAIVFGVYGNLSRALGTDEKTRTLRSEFICGSIAGLSQTIITSPMELIKTRKQLSTSNSSKVSVRGLFRQRELFRGLTATVARDVPGLGTYFATYQATLDVLDERNKPSIFNHLIAGGLAGQASWVIVYPVDVAKTRIQIAPDKYRRIVPTLIRIWRDESWRALFSGLGPALVRAFPVNAVTFTVVSYTLMMWERMCEFR